MKRISRPLAIVLIVCIALIAGLAVNFVWTLFEKLSYPQKYSEYVEKYATEYNVPEEIIYATIKVESSFKFDAESGAGAQGLMQLMPTTFEWLTGDEHLGEFLPPEAVFDPEVNIRYGTYYLKYLHSKFDQNWETAFAAYNGGEGNVAKWLEDSRYSDSEGNLKAFPKEFRETKNYVRKIKKSLEMYERLYY